MEHYYLSRYNIIPIIVQLSNISKHQSNIEMFGNVQNVRGNL